MRSLYFLSFESKRKRYDKQLDNLEEKVQMMEEGITSSLIKNGYHEEKEEDLPDEILDNLQKLRLIEKKKKKMDTD